MPAVEVKAGQRWSGRRRALVVEQVRRPVGEQAYALCHEVKADGRRASGRDRHGVPRGLSFRVPLAHFGEILSLVGKA